VDKPERVRVKLWVSFLRGFLLVRIAKFSSDGGTDPLAAEYEPHGFADFWESTKPKTGIRPFEQQGREVGPKHDLSRVAIATREALHTERRPQFPCSGAWALPQT